MLKVDETVIFVWVVVGLCKQRKEKLWYIILAMNQKM